jgi:hypothetical protein
MFWKKQPKKSSQSQSISNVTVSGGAIQQGQAKGNLHQTQSGTLETQQQITNTKVVELLESLETAVKASALNPAQQDELLDYLHPAKREAAKENGSKDLVGQYLKPVNESLKIMKDSTEAGKSLWNTGQEVFTAIAPWLGMAAKLIGLP